MKTKQVHFDDVNTDFLLFDRYSFANNTNKAEIEKMKHILFAAIRRELTPRQQQCVTEHFLKDNTQREVAKELGLDESTVSRHLTVAKRKLKNIASYF